MNATQRTLTTLVALAALIAAPALSTASGSDACMWRDDCAPLTLYLAQQALAEEAPTRLVPTLSPVWATPARAAEFSTGVLEEDLPLHEDGALTFRLHRDGVAPGPGTQYGTMVVIMEIDAQGTRHRVLEHTVWGAPDLHPDAANPLTGTGPRAEGYEAFAIPVAALATSTLEAGHEYVLTFHLEAAPTPTATGLAAVDAANCAAGGIARSVFPGSHPCPLAPDQLPIFDDVLYYDAASHPSHVTLPVAVAHAP